MPQGVKKDLMNLEIDFSRRKSPKRKLKRSMESQIISMCNKLYGFHPEQRALMLRAAAANLGQAEEDDTEKLVLGLLQKIKPCKSADAKAIKSLLCGLVYDHLRELSRDQRRAVGASDGAFRAAQSVVEKLEQKDFSWMHPEKVIRSTKPNMTRLAREFFEEMSTPLKFSKSNKRILNYSIQKTFQLFQERYAEEIAEQGFSRSSFYRLHDKSRYLPHQKATFYSCPTHVTAQSVLEEAKPALQRYHRKEACPGNGCEKCSFIASFPSTVHDFVNKKLSPCQTRNPSLQCVNNECETCYIDPENHVNQLFLDAGFDLTDEKLADESLVYSVYEDTQAGSYKIKELKHYRDDPEKVLPIWSKQLADVVPHQIRVWTVRQAIAALSQMPNPRLPIHIIIMQIDYQQNLHALQQLMQAAQNFQSVTFTIKTLVTDILWRSVDPQKLERPEVLPSEDFQNEICRIACSHLRGGAGQKHNAQTATQSLEVHLKWLISIAPQLHTALIASDGSPKEYFNAPYLKGIAELANKLGISIVQVYHAAHHGSSPCDAEQRVVKEFNDDLGIHNVEFDDAIKNLHARLNSPEGQPIERGKTVLRRAEILPSMETSTSNLKALRDTRSYSAYWTIEREPNKLKRRCFLCTHADCCNYFNQTDDCKYIDSCGAIETIEFEIDPQKAQASGRPRTRARSHAPNRSGPSAVSSSHAAPNRSSSAGANPRSRRGSALSRSSSVGSGGSRSEARRRGSPGVRPGRGKRAERKDSSEDS